MQNIEEIYSKYSEIVYKYIFCLTGNKEVTEDIVQETFLVAVKDINKFRGECKISTWLCQIAKNIWHKTLNKDKRAQTEELKEEIPIDNTTEEIICHEEDRLKLFKQMQKLDEITRNVMYLRILGNLDYDEIANVMNKTANWARVTFFRGKQKLREENKNE